MKPLTMAHVQGMINNQEEKKPIHDYLKTFTKLSEEKAKELEEKLRGLNNVKIKEEYLIKIVDLLPRDSEELNKIFQDVSLEESEIAKIIEIVQRY